MMTTQGNRLPGGSLAIAILGLTIAILVPPLAAQAPARPASSRYPHNGPVYFVGFAAEGKHLVTASQDGFIRVWDVGSGKELHRLGKLPRVVNADGFPLPSNVALSADGQTVAAACPDGTVQRAQLGKEQTLRTITRLPEPQAGKPTVVLSITFSPDGKLLALRGDDLVVRLHEVSDGKEVRRINLQGDAKPRGRVRFAGDAFSDHSLAFSADGKLLATAGVDFDNQQQVGVIRSWEVTTGAEARQVKLRQVNPFFDSRTGYGIAALRFAADGRLLVAWASTDGTARLYDAAAGKEIRRLDAVQQGVHVVFVYSPDGKTLAVRDITAPTVRLYDTASGKKHPSVGEGDGGSQSFAFAPDGKTLAVGTANGTVQLFDVATGKTPLPSGGD